MRLPYSYLAGVYAFCMLMMLNACSSDDPTVGNPFDQQQSEPGHTIIIDSLGTLEPSSIEGLHASIFKPTCANSGCHDGNFEPDFRTIESSYNTLVYRPVIKNDDQNPIRYRVRPGNPDSSMLLVRLLKDLNGNSGIMPLVLETENDWETTKNEHINNIKKWIEDGALGSKWKCPRVKRWASSITGNFWIFKRK